MSSAAGAGAKEVPKAIIKNVDMEADVQHSVVELAADAMTRFSLEKDMAASVKRAADEKFGPTWHVIVGRSFGSFVTHGASITSSLTQSLSILSTFVRRMTRAYADLGPMAFLVWRA